MAIEAGRPLTFLSLATVEFVEPRPSDDLEEQIGEWLTPQQWGDHLAAGRVATLGAAIAVYAGILAFPKMINNDEASKRGACD